MVKILVAARIHRKAIEMLEKRGFSLVYREEPDEEELVNLVRDAEVLIVRSKPLVTRKVIYAGKKLKIIARAGVGLDNIDLDAARERGIEVINAPEAVTNSVAELTIGLMLSALRKIAYADRMMRRGIWPKKESIGYELRGKTLGIIGMGRIGRAVARMARYGFGMKILYYDVIRCPKEFEEEVGAVYTDLDSLLRGADVVSIHVPLTPKTKHLINESRLKLMKKNAILVNTSRGGVVDTNALIKALREGWIAGAAIDVYEEEPLPPNHPLTKLENVVLTPHIGASTYEALERASIDIAEKVINFFEKTVPGDTTGSKQRL
ncbi:MAG: 3-phosphoglycerate dehydrogenase [Thermoprotei archaeon]|nr:MAG: 3-phosphoglycerate dehydrogenase [Thermoprotei archaeon]